MIIIYKKELNKIMNKEIIEYAIMFLNRTELKGSEVPQFIAVMQELQRLYLSDTKSKPAPEPDPDDLDELDTGENDKVDFDEGDTEDEPEVKEKDIKHLKKDISDIMAEVDQL